MSQGLSIIFVTCVKRYYFSAVLSYSFLFFRATSLHHAARSISHSLHIILSKLGEGPPLHSTLSSSLFVDWQEMVFDGRESGRENGAQHNFFLSLAITPSIQFRPLSALPGTCLHQQVSLPWCCWLQNFSVTANMKKATDCPSIWATSCSSEIPEKLNSPSSSSELPKKI